MVQTIGGISAGWGLVLLLTIFIVIKFLVNTIFPDDVFMKQKRYQASPKQKRLLKKRSIFRSFFDKVSPKEAFQTTIKAAELKLKDMERRLTRLPPHEMAAKNVLRKQIKDLADAIDTLENFYVEFILY